MSTIPVYLLTGYLGSGKTTVLNHWIRSPELARRKVALIINEFGSLGIDGQLVEHGDGSVFELTRGSLFCSCIQPDFAQTLITIAQDIQPDLVVAEATGVAETGTLCNTFALPQVAGRYEIQACVCVVDGQNFAKVLPFFKAPRTQVLDADGIVINKRDLFDDRAVERLTGMLREMNSRAPQIAVSQGQVPWDFVTQLQHAGFSDTATDEPPAEIAACSLLGQRAERQRLLNALQAVEDRLLRLKGIVDFGNGPVLVEWVLGSWSERPVSSRQPRYGLTVIGWNTTGQLLEDSFAGVLEDSSPPVIDIELA